MLIGILPSLLKRTLSGATSTIHVHMSELQADSLKAQSTFAPSETLIVGVVSTNFCRKMKEVIHFQSLTSSNNQDTFKKVCINQSDYS